MIVCCEGDVHYCCLKSYGVFYFSNVWWDHIPDVICTGVKGEQCSVDAALVCNVGMPMHSLLFALMNDQNFLGFVFRLSPMWLFR